MESILSAASTKERTAADDTPCAAGLLRGRYAPRQVELLRATSVIMERVFMLVTSPHLFLRLANIPTALAASHARDHASAWYRPRTRIRFSPFCPSTHHA